MEDSKQKKTTNNAQKQLIAKYGNFNNIEEELVILLDYLLFYGLMLYFTKTIPEINKCEI